MKTWICERHSRAVTTLLVEANTRKEAQEKLDQRKGDGVGTEYYDIGRARVVREDRPRKKK